MGSSLKIGDLKPIYDLFKGEHDVWSMDLGCPISKHTQVGFYTRLKIVQGHQHWRPVGRGERFYDFLCI